MSLLLLEGDGGGAYAQDKNTSARLCTKSAGRRLCTKRAYLRDTIHVVLYKKKLPIYLCWVCWWQFTTQHGLLSVSGLFTSVNRLSSYYGFWATGCLLSKLVQLSCHSWCLACFLHRTTLRYITESRPTSLWTSGQFTNLSSLHSFHNMYIGKNAMPSALSWYTVSIWDIPFISFVAKLTTSV